MALGKVKVKKSRKEKLREPDEFVATTGSLMDRIIENPKRFVIGLLVLVFITLLWIIITHIIVETRRAIGDEFYHAQKVFDARVVQDEDEYKRAKKQNPDEPIFKSNEEKFKAAQKKFEKFIEEHPSSNFTPLARFYLAVSEIQLRKPSAAEPHLSKLLEDLSESDPLHALAHKLLGQVYEEQQQWQKALEQYKMLEQEETGYLRDAALYLQGRMLARLGKTKEAQEVLKRLTKEYEDSNFKTVAEKLGMALESGVDFTAKQEKQNQPPKPDQTQSQPQPKEK